MSAVAVEKPRAQLIAERLAQGYRVSDVEDDFGAQRREVMDAGFAYQLRYVPSRDAFDVTDRTHRVILSGRPAPVAPRRSSLIRPVVITDPEPQTARPAPEATVPDLTAARGGAVALRARIEALGVDAKTIRTWAHLRGLDCPVQGVLPGRIVEAYEAWDAAGRPAMPMPEPPGPPERPALESTDWEALSKPLPSDDVEAEVDAEEPSVARVVAIAVGSSPALVAAIMTAATNAAEFDQVSVEDGWIYLEQAAS